MKIIAALAQLRQRRRDGEPGRNELRRDIGLETKPTPRREWQDYL